MTEVGVREWCCTNTCQVQASQKALAPTLEASFGVFCSLMAECSCADMDGTQAPRKLGNLAWLPGSLAVIHAAAISSP